MKDSAIIEFVMKDKNKKVELEIPTNITASELAMALNEAYDLGMDVKNVYNCYLVSENPIAFLRGNKQLSAYGIHNGTRIIYKRR